MRDELRSREKQLRAAQTVPLSRRRKATSNYRMSACYVRELAAPSGSPQRSSVAAQPVNPRLETFTMTDPRHKGVKPEQESQGGTEGKNPVVVAGTKKQRQCCNHNCGAVPLTERTTLPGDVPDYVQEHSRGDQRDHLHVDASVPAVIHGW